MTITRDHVSTPTGRQRHRLLRLNRKLSVLVLQVEVLHTWSNFVLGCIVDNQETFWRDAQIEDLTVKKETT
jgi:hypothetical protein